ncbi:MAG: hypothetical protein QOG85_1291 [Gaiellaceae bacterium]|nr:hypothetical protein [Gaiellaceae bacterium]
MRKGALVILTAIAVSLLAVGQAASQPDWAGECGIPTNQTVWADYSWSTLLPVMARPGTVLALTNGSDPTDYSAQARALGAATYSLDVQLKRRVGTPDVPADTGTIAGAAKAQYDSAVKRSGGCPSPLIVENELFGAATVTPWSAANAQYRANVLAYLQDLAGLGAHPVLLLARPAYLGSAEAVSWWLQVAQVADIVREDYVPATAVWKLGATRGNRLLREAYRASVAPFMAIGIPGNRLGIMVSVLSQKGGGGRNGLEPDSAWYQVVKWYALSAKQVAGELGLGSVFSWGWQQWNPSEVDPTKEDAACAWLWARDNSLCDAPEMLGGSFDPSLTAGQIALPTGAYCAVPGYGPVGDGALTHLSAVTGDRAAALSILYRRLVERHYATASSTAILAAEQEVVDAAFGGSRDAYLAAIAQAHLSVAAARAALGDEIRRATLEQRRVVATPKPADVAGFYQAYPQLLVRRVKASPAAPWLAGTREGYAVAGAAPDAVFSIPTGQTSKVWTLLGTFSVSPEGAPVPLGSRPFTAAQTAIVSTLEAFARAHAFERWTIGEQRDLLDVAICRADDLPEPAAIDVTQYVPFLELR